MLTQNIIDVEIASGKPLPSGRQSIGIYLGQRAGLKTRCAQSCRD